MKDQLLVPCTGTNSFCDHELMTDWSYGHMTFVEEELCSQLLDQVFNFCKVHFLLLRFLTFHFSHIL